jgi:hypothetical protein
MLSLSRVTACAVTCLCLVGAGACTRSGDRAADAREVSASVAASEALMLAFRDSVRGFTEEEKARRASAETPLVGADTLDACTYPVPASGDVRLQTTSIFVLALPANFTLTLDGEKEIAARHEGYGRYEWTASDGSTARVEPVNNDEAHSGWTGSISSECDLDIGGRRVHIDVANASVYVPDRVVHAHIDLRPHLALSFLGHARTLARQAELLRAVHSIRITPDWGAAR